MRYFYSKTKALHEAKKQVVSTLILIYFGSSRRGHIIKVNCRKFQTVDPEIWSILIFVEQVL